MAFQVLLYYRYSPIPDPDAYHVAHRELCERLNLRGRILIAEEGINGTVSGLTTDTEAYMRALREDPITSGIEFKIDPADDHAFKKLSIKVRDEVVTLALEGESDIDPNAVTGKRLSPREFREAMESEDVVLLDGRNDYETAIGKFRDAVCPDVENFRDFPKWIRENFAHLKEKKILTYCTGGIRCEKLSGFLIEEGFEDVSQLEGGIVEYGKDDSVRGELFDGKCYVFDQRVAVDVNRTDTATVISNCVCCGEASPRYRNCAYKPCNDQFFICEKCEEARGRFCGDPCRERFAGASAV